MIGGELPLLAFPGTAMRQVHGRKLHLGLLNIRILMQLLAQEVLDRAVPGTGRIHKKYLCLFALDSYFVPKYSLL